MHAIESDEYRDEVARLVEDPIIQAMAAEIRDDDVREIPYESWDFMARASDEFHRRGGEAFSIGGPARAIQQLVGRRS